MFSLFYRRLTPVTGVNLRILEQDVVLSGYKVPAQVRLDCNFR